MSEDITTKILSNAALAAAWDARADHTSDPEVARVLRECANELKHGAHILAMESSPSLGKEESTPRGFSIIKFTDRNNQQCSIQTSSAADFSHCSEDDQNCFSRPMLWLGVSEVKPVIMAQDAIAMGIPTGGVSRGWVPYHIPEQVLLSSRMHLTIPMVKALVHDLQRWLDIEDYT